jgi:PAP2 superfamily
MKTKMKLLMPLFALAFILPTGCKKEVIGDQNPGKHNIPAFLSDAEVPLAWFKLAIALVRTTAGNTGPVASRTFGYMGLALYESVVPGMPEHRSIQGQLNGLTVLPKAGNDKKYFDAISANAALANMTHHMFGNASPAQNFTIDSLENVFNTEFKSFVTGTGLGQATSKDYDRSVQFGQDISNTIYNWSTTDGGDKAYANIFPPDYTPPVGPGLWVPQPGQAAQNSHWGNNRTFIAGNASSTQPGLPPAYSTDPASQMYKEESEVYNESINQDPEHRAIALYWAAIPPPTVSISILGSVLTDKNADLYSAALDYCKLGIAIADAFVSCYKTKYTYNQLRPITYIRANFNASWSPLLGTPPFPDYTSAHSVQTGAAARVLADIFGDNTTFTDYSINDLGFTPRTFNKFSDYANEVGLSRIYGGIHIRSSDFIGLDQGNKVGMHVSALHFRN